MATCVFCDEPIAGDEPVTGRPPMAAHSRCADAALADDSHWDAIAARSPGADHSGGGPQAEPRPPGGRSGRSAVGCGVVAFVAVVGVAVSGAVSKRGGPRP